MKVRAALALVYRFVLALIASGLSTAWTIVRPEPEMQPGFVRMPYGLLDERGAVLLSGMTCLTPGTTVVDIDIERRELLIHLLDVRNADDTLRQIREQFEAPLARLFPLRGER